MTEFLEKYPEAGATCPIELTKEGELASDFAWHLPTYWQTVKSVMPIYTKLNHKNDKPFLWFYDPQRGCKA